MTRYEVQGAGFLMVELDSVGSTGTAVGLSIAESWGKHPGAGGVMDYEEVARLHRDLGVWLRNAEDMDFIRKTRDRLAESRKRLEEMGLLPR